MGFFDFLSSGVKDHFDKKRQEREMMEQIQKEAHIQQMIAFGVEYKKNAFEVAEAKAKEDAIRLSGIHKLRATNLAIRMGEGENPDKSDFFKRFSEYTQRNIAKRETNLKRTAQLRGTAQKIKEDTMAKKISERNQKLVKKPFTINHGKPK